MSMGRGGLFGNPKLMPWEEEIERQRQRIEAEMGQSAPQQQVPAGGLLGQPLPQQGFWQGGEKFRAKDGIAGLLAVIGDAIAANHGSGSMGATQSLMGGRFDAMEEAKKRAAEQEQLQAAYATADRLGVSRDMVNAKRYGVPVPEPEKRKGLRPVAGPTGVFVWDADNERFAAPQGGIPGSSADEWEDIDEDTARRLGGGTGNGAGGFRYPR